MIDGLINLEEIHYKTLLLLFHRRIYNYKINVLIALFLPYDVPFCLKICLAYNYMTHHHH